MQEHVMLDLETMGDCNNAPILSIGAVKFDTDAILDEFHVGVELASCMALGLRPTAGTIMWWLHPDRAEARDALLNLETVDLGSALMGFAEWFGEEKPIWGNGATFDNVILRNAYAACGLDYPTPFWNDLCYRTVKSETLAAGIKLVREGTHHNALDDARCQAKHLQAIWRAQRERDELLNEAGKQFRFYEANHLAKETADGNRKAKVNADFASRIEDLQR